MPIKDNEEIIEVKKAEKVIVTMLGNYDSYIFNEAYEFEKEKASYLVLLGYAKYTE